MMINEQHLTSGFGINYAGCFDDKRLVKRGGNLQTACMRRVQPF